MLYPKGWTVSEQSLVEGPEQELRTLPVEVRAQGVGEQTGRKAAFSSLWEPWGSKRLQKQEELGRPREFPSHPSPPL